MVAAAIVLSAVGTALLLGVLARGRDEAVPCGSEFVRSGPRCAIGGERCPPPLVAIAHGCDAPRLRILVPTTALSLGSFDWEEEGRVPARTMHVLAFRVDAFEVTRGRWGETDGGDLARAKSGVTRDEAAAFCATSGGRLPTEDEWIVAAVSAVNPPRRYPWGDTGAVCRRAAWGLASGPCATGGDGPDTVGAHPDGDSLLGMHDLAGNVAEWVAPDDRHARRGLGLAKGGSWQSTLASELRVWAGLELSPDARDPRVGLRCAYPP
jgi:formylglycine-generating enzyme required for sulfatase activity